MWKKFFNKRTIYIGLFALLYGICGFISLYHSIAFFGLANENWMATMLAFAFEVGQAAVLFSLLTSKKDRSKFLPWLLMFIFTTVQIMGNIFSSYKHLMLYAGDSLQYFKEPIFIWTDLPDAQCNVILAALLGGLLPITCLALTSMITNFLEDENKEDIKEEAKEISNDPEVATKVIEENEPLELLTDNKEELEEKIEEEQLFGTGRSPVPERTGFINL